MMPSTVQKKEDGPWERWNNGSVNMLELNQRVDVDNKYLFVRGVQVFAFCFIDEEAKTRRMWNVKTGWQTKGML